MDGSNPPIQIAPEQWSYDISNKQELQLVEKLQSSHDENMLLNSTENDSGGWFDDCCIKTILQQIWCLLIYAAAGLLNILDSVLIKIVNRFYYHNI